MKPISSVLKKRQGQLWQVSPTDSVYHALEILAQHEVGALLVMSGHQLVGIVSERDYTRKIALAGKSSRDTLVKDRVYVGAVGDISSACRKRSPRSASQPRARATRDGVRATGAATSSVARLTPKSRSTFGRSAIWFGWRFPT